jgi:hypothetical protein
VDDWRVLQSADDVVINAAPSAPPGRAAVQVVFDVNCP